MKITMRQERPADHPKVEALIEAAFAKLPESDQTEHQLVARLRWSDAFIPELSIVAEVGEEIAGHIILTRILIRNGPKAEESLALAPVSVHPTWQRQGIGGQLIREAHRVAAGLGHGSVVLLGHADYYPRFGYRKASEYGIQLPFEVPEELCMAIELRSGALDGVSGMVEYPQAFLG